jgi:hypothetical protein
MGTAEEILWSWSPRRALDWVWIHKEKKEELLAMPQKLSSSYDVTQQLHCKRYS